MFLKYVYPYRVSWTQILSNRDMFSLLLLAYYAENFFKNARKIFHKQNKSIKVKWEDIDDTISGLTAPKYLMTQLMQYGCHGIYYMFLMFLPWFCFCFHLISFSLTLLFILSFHCEMVCSEYFLYVSVGVYSTQLPAKILVCRMLIKPQKRDLIG